MDPVLELPKLIAETPDFWVVDKPAGWLTKAPDHARPGRAAEPVLHQWLSRDRSAKAWVIHRLDRETSGLVLFARSADAHRRACLWFEKRQAKKLYDCLASGTAGAPVLRFDAPIEGKRCLTQVECVKQGPTAFLGRVRLETGRRHQIRIHLSRAGHPLLGDSRYGGPSDWSPAAGAPAMRVGRVALHARRLELPEGAGAWESPWPRDFALWAERISSR